MFEVLGIAPTSDVKAIKRAYAASLKKIDQQTQSAEFEQLRAAYERALAWAKQNAEPSVAADAFAGAAADGPAGPQSAAGGQYAMPQPAIVMRHGPGGGTHREARQRAEAVDMWAERLLAASDEELPGVWRELDGDWRMEHIDVEEPLSRKVLRGIIDAPQGRLALYEQGMQRFGWNDLSRRNRQTEQTAWFLLGLEQERQIWDAQDRKFRDGHRRAMDRALATPRPGRRDAKRSFPQLATLQRHMPLWLTLSLPAGRFDAFKQAWGSRPLPQEKQKASIFKYWWVIFLVAGLTRYILPDFSKNNPPPWQPTVAQPAVVPPAGGSVLTIPSPPPPRAEVRNNLQVEYQGKQVTRELVVPKAHYPASSQVRGEAGTVVIKLRITPEGKVDASVEKSSGYEALDKMALEAISLARIEGGPFSKPVNISLPYSFKLRSGKEKATPATPATPAASHAP